ncbi:hypothetical protein J537_1375 [Acinetobacter baumannii 1437282]|nr:hypothetical protein J537_1375 [Acinetobacter baumannii 1437282]
MSTYLKIRSVPAFSILDEMKEILYLFYRFLIQVAEDDDEK